MVTRQSKKKKKIGLTVKSSFKKQAVFHFFAIFANYCKLEAYTVGLENVLKSDIAMPLSV